MRLPRNGDRASSSRKFVLRAGLVLAMLPLLTLFYFYQFVALADAGSSGYHPCSLSRLSIAIRLVPLLWWCSFLPAVAVGFAGLAWLYRPRVRPSALVEQASRRRTRAFAYGSLCTALCLNLLAYRLVVALLMASPSTWAVPQPLVDLEWGARGWVATQVDPLGPFVAVGWLAAAVVLLQAWNVLGYSRAARRRIFVLFAFTLAAGVAFGVARVYARLPLPLEADLEEWLLRPSRPPMAEIDGVDGLARRVPTYLQTHDVDLRPVGSNGLRVRNVDDCDVTRLPATLFLTPTGIPLELARTVSSAAPRTVVEIPRRGDVARIFDGEEGIFRREIPVGELAGARLDGDWLVLKIDDDLAMARVYEVIRGLRAAGARRISLGVFPTGFRRPPDRPVAMEIGSVGDLPVYRPGGCLDSAPTAPCEKSELWSSSDLLGDLEIPADGEVPAEVVLALHPDDRYAAFVWLLDRAILGGASTVHLAPPG